MNKRIGFVIVGILVITAIVPGAFLALPSRDMAAEMMGVHLSGLKGAAGEYASGEHQILVNLKNTGDTDFVSDVSFNINVTYSTNGTVLSNKTVSKLVYLIEGGSGNFSITPIEFPEGSFELNVTGTIEGTVSHYLLEIEVMDVVDLAVENTLFVPDGHYRIGSPLTPTCTVTYEGNVEDWKDDVSVQLVIELISESPFVTKYDEEMMIMSKMSSPVDPGEVFSVQFSVPWTPNEPGDYRAKYMVDYDNYNTSNNDSRVFFTVDELPSIEGWVTTEEMDPLEGVDVLLEDAMGEVETAITYEDGYYSFFDLATASYTLTFSRIWLSTADEDVEFLGTLLVVNATLTKLALGGLEGTVMLPDLGPADQAQVVVTIPGQAPNVAMTGSDGSYEIESLPAGFVGVTASLPGYADAVELNFTIYEQQWNTLDLTLGEVPFSVTFDPPNGEPGFPVTGSMTLAFTRPLKKNTVNSSTIYLVDDATSILIPVFYSFDDADSTVILTPEDNLDYDTEYMMVVTTDLEDINGIRFPEEATSAFTTETEIVEIFVTQFYPMDNADKIPINVKVWARFPEPMDESTINTSTFKVFAQGSSVPVAGTVIYAAGNYTATFTPASNLAYATRYSVVLEDEIQPVSETRFFIGKSWSFQTKQLITTGTVSGYIFDEDGKPFDPAKVKVMFIGGGKNLTGTYNAQGKFESPALSAGIWTMKVSVSGYETYTKHDILVTAEKVTTLPAIEMEKEEEKTDWTVPIIVLIVIIVVIVAIAVAALLLSKKEEPEDTRRGPVFGTRLRGEPYGGYEPEYIEGEFMCPNCGNVVMADDPTCSNCGAEFENDLFECPECGGLIAPDATECPDCGAKFEEELPEGEEEELPEEEPEPDISREYQVEELSDSDIPLGPPEAPQS